MLPPLLLAVVAAIILVARIAALRRLAPAARTRGALWRWSGLTLAALLLVVTAARPVLDPADARARRVADSQAPNVFLVVDRSPDMRVAGPARRGVEDAGGARRRRRTDRPVPRRPRRRHLLRDPGRAGLAAVGGHLEPATGGVATLAPYAASPRRRRPRPMRGRPGTCCAIS